MKIIYFIGNGTRPSQQLDYLCLRTTFSCNFAPIEWHTWGFLPDFWSFSEDPIYKNNLLYCLENLDLNNPEVQKILPKYVKGEMNFPNTRYLPVRQYDCRKPGEKGKLILRFGCTGANCVGIALNVLDFDHAVLIGCDAFRTDVYDTPVPLNPKHAEMRLKFPDAYLKKTNDREIRSWRRLAKWRDIVKPDSIILNASQDSKIDCLPRIELGAETNYFNGKLPIPKIENLKYARTN